MCTPFFSVHVLQDMYCDFFFLSSRVVDFLYVLTTAEFKTLAFLLLNVLLVLDVPKTRFFGVFVYLFILVVETIHRG